MSVVHREDFYLPFALQQFDYHDRIMIGLPPVGPINLCVRNRLGQETVSRKSISPTILQAAIVDQSHRFDAPFPGVYELRPSRHQKPAERSRICRRRSDTPLPWETRKPPSPWAPVIRSIFVCGTPRDHPIATLPRHPHQLLKNRPRSIVRENQSICSQESFHCNRCSLKTDCLRLQSASRCPGFIGPTDDLHLILTIGIWSGRWLLGNLGPDIAHQ